MENDSDIDPIRNTIGYKKLIKNLNDPVFNILTVGNRNSFFQYFDNFLYAKDVSLLKTFHSDGTVSFIPLSSIKLSKNKNNIGILVYDRFICDENIFTRQIGTTYDDLPSVFGYITEPISKELIVIYYNTNNNKILYKDIISNWSQEYYSNLNNLEPVTDSTTAFSLTYTLFVSGFITNLMVLEIRDDDQNVQIVNSTPITISSEDLSGGSAPVIKFVNLRKDGASFLIDVYKDEKFQETKTIDFNL